MATLSPEAAASRLEAKTAETKVKSFLESTESVQGLVDLLFQTQREEITRSAVRELTRQGIVLLWSAFEVLARDLFVALLNSKPSRASRLLTNKRASRRFELHRIDWHVLSENEFDLSAKLGSILIAKSELKGVPAIKDVFSALFPNNGGLVAALGADGLWHLSQQRHLVVHRRGVVDEKFREETGSTIPLGGEFWPTPNDVQDQMRITVKAGFALLSCCASSGE